MAAENLSFWTVMNTVLQLGVSAIQEPYTNVTTVVSNVAALDIRSCSFCFSVPCKAI